MLLLALLGLQLHGVAHLLEREGRGNDCPACDQLLHQAATPVAQPQALPEAPSQRVALSISAAPIAFVPPRCSCSRGPPAPLGPIA